MISAAEAKELIEGVIEKRQEAYGEAYDVLRVVAGHDDPFEICKMAEQIARMRKEEAGRGDPLGEKQLMRHSIWKGVEAFFHDQVREMVEKKD